MHIRLVGDWTGELKRTGPSLEHRFMQSLTCAEKLAKRCGMGVKDADFKQAYEMPV